MKSRAIFSTILSMVLIFTLISPAMAAANELAPSNNMENVVLSNVEGSRAVFQCEEYSNGNSRVFLIENGIITAETYVDRSEGTTRTIDHQSDTTTEKAVVQPCNQRSGNSIAYASAQFQPKGTITYKYYMQGVAIGTRDMALSYASTGQNISGYHPQGPYSNATELVGALSLAFGIPAAAAGATVGWILSTLGIATAARNFSISNYYVSANKSFMQWRGTCGTGTVNFAGNRYIFTDNRGHTQTEYDGDYYSVTAYSSHNTLFAEEFYIRMFGNDMHDIVSWS